MVGDLDSAIFTLDPTIVFLECVTSAHFEKSGYPCGTEGVVGPLPVNGEGQLPFHECRELGGSEAILVDVIEEGDSRLTVAVTGKDIPQLVGDILHQGGMERGVARERLGGKCPPLECLGSCPFDIVPFRAKKKVARRVMVCQVNLVAFGYGQKRLKGKPDYAPQCVAAGSTHFCHAAPDPPRQLHGLTFG